MELREEILKEHSKKQSDLIVHWIGDSQAHFDELFRLFMNDEYRVVQRAGWPLSIAVRAHPFLIKKHIKSLISNLTRAGVHGAVKRNVMRILADIDIPKSYHGKVLTFCLEIIQLPEEAIAVKAFALAVLEKLAGPYPEIIPEIKLIVTQQMSIETAAYKSRAKRILKLKEETSS